MRLKGKKTNAVTWAPELSVALKELRRKFNNEITFGGWSVERVYIARLNIINPTADDVADLSAWLASQLQEAKIAQPCIMDLSLKFIEHVTDKNAVVTVKQSNSKSLLIRMALLEKILAEVGERMIPKKSAVQLILNCIYLKQDYPAAAKADPLLWLMDQIVLDYALTLPEEAVNAPAPVSSPAQIPSLKTLLTALLIYEQSPETDLTSEGCLLAQSQWSPNYLPHLKDLFSSPDSAFATSIQRRDQHQTSHDAKNVIETQHDQLIYIIVKESTQFKLLEKLAELDNCSLKKIASVGPRWLLAHLERLRLELSDELTSAKSSLLLGAKFQMRDSDLDGLLSTKLLGEFLADRLTLLNGLINKTRQLLALPLEQLDQQPTLDINSIEPVLSYVTASGVELPYFADHPLYGYYTVSELPEPVTAATKLKPAILSTLCYMPLEKFGDILQQYNNKHRLFPSLWIPEIKALRKLYQQHHNTGSCIISYDDVSAVLSDACRYYGGKYHRVALLRDPTLPIPDDHTRQSQVIREIGRAFGERTKNAVVNAAEDQRDAVCLHGL